MSRNDKACTNMGITIVELIVVITVIGFLDSPQLAFPLR
jgi:Tfp pilus assembly protein PilE